MVYFFDCVVVMSVWFGCVCDIVDIGLLCLRDFHVKRIFEFVIYTDRIWR